MFDANGNPIANVGGVGAGNQQGAPAPVAVGNNVPAPLPPQLQTPGCVTILPFGMNRSANVVPALPNWNVDPQAVNGSNGDFFQDTVTNNTAATQNAVVSAVAGQPGDYSKYNISPSGVDQPLMLDDFGANLSKLQGFNQLLVEQPLIASQIIIQTSSAAQSNQSWTIGYFSTNLELVSTKRLTTLCDYCNNNNNSNLFTKAIQGPLYLGGNTFLSYPVLAGQSVTIQVYVSAKGTDSFSNANC